MWPHTLDEMSTIILIFCRDGANKIELIEKCYLNDIDLKKTPSQIENVLSQIEKALSPGKNYVV